MKTYLKKSLALLLAVLLPFVAAFGLLLKMPDHRGGTIAGSLRYKTHLLEQTPGPRIIFAGGSSSPYGTVCEEVQRQLGRTTINVGATAYLGLPLYLKLLRQHAVAGDVIVLALENSLLQGEGINYSLVWEAAGQDPQVWRSVPLSYLPGVACSGLEYYRMKKAVLHEEKPSYHPDFGPLGDVTAPRQTLLESGYLGGDPIYLQKENIYEKNIRRINRFAREMKKRGVTVVFAFAPLDILAVQTNAQQNADFAAAVEEKLEIPVIVGMDKALMEGRYFYDSNNHLTSEGAAINTANLIQGLRPYL